MNCRNIEKIWKKRRGFGQDDEELFELAMHDRQYRDYKSGIAKRNLKRTEKAQILDVKIIVKR